MFIIPGFVTHIIFGETVYKQLNEKSKTIIDKHNEVYNIGTQGPDIFFFYLTSFLNKNTRNLGQKLHKQQIGEFFEQLTVQASKIKDEKDKEIAFSYISGYLTHYVLDANTHPYIYFKSGFYKNNIQPFQLRYSLLHRRMEKAIDNMLHESLSSKEKDAKVWEIIKANDREKYVVAKIMATAIQNVYDVEVTPVQVAKAMQYTVEVTKYLDILSMKRHKVTEYDKTVTIGEDHIIDFHHRQKKDGVDYLNLDNNMWTAPWDRNIQYESSFVELYNKSISEAIEMIETFYLFIENEITLDELKQIVKSRSLKAGNDTSEQVDFLYHDIIFKKSNRIKG